MSRTAFLGTSAFAALILGRLAETRHRPALVLAPPDRPRGRGRKTAAPAVAEQARELGLELVQSADVNAPESLDAIRRADPEVVCVCQFGQLIREPLLSERLLLNVHPSLLPRWRGAAPIERAIMAGDEATGVCVIGVSANLDAGPVALREETALGAGETFGELSGRLAEIGARLLPAALDLAESGSLTMTEQEDRGISYAEKIGPAEGRLDPSRRASELSRVVRALTPHIGAYLLLDGAGRLGVRAVRAESGPVGQGAIQVSDGSLLLGCVDGVLRIEEVQPPGGRWMAVAAYLRGHPAPALALAP